MSVGPLEVGLLGLLALAFFGKKSKSKEEKSEVSDQPQPPTTASFQDNNTKYPEPTKPVDEPKA